MVDNRLEWTISRQRRWGSPITFLRCVDCREKGVVSHFPRVEGDVSEKEKREREDFFERVREAFREHGANAWYDDAFPPSYFLSKSSSSSSPLRRQLVFRLRRVELREAEGHPRRLVRLGRLARRRAPLGRLRPRGPVHGEAARPGPLPRGPRPAPRLVPVVSPDVRRPHGPRPVRRRAHARLRRRGRRPEDVEVARQHDRAAGPPQDGRRRRHPALGRRRSTTRTTIRSRRRSSSARPRPTGRSGTRRASSSRTSSTSTPRRTPCRTRSSSRSTAGSSTRAARFARRGAGGLRALRVPRGRAPPPRLRHGRPLGLLVRRPQGRASTSSRRTTACGAPRRRPPGRSSRRSPSRSRRSARSRRRRSSSRCRGTRRTRPRCS